MLGGKTLILSTWDPASREEEKQGLEHERVIFLLKIFKGFGPRAFVLTEK